MEVVKDAFDELADDAMARAGGDAPKAAELMVKKMNEDADFYAAIRDDLLRNACHMRLLQMRSALRRLTWSPPANYDAGGHGKRLLGGMLENSLLGFPLPVTGKLLGKSTKQDIHEAANFYATHELDSGRKKRWLNLIWKNVPAGKLVGEVLKEQQLRDLQKQAERV